MSFPVFFKDKEITSNRLHDPRSDAGIKKVKKMWIFYGFLFILTVLIIYYNFTNQDVQKTSLF